jgi:xanthine/CO dehydrogenase XdhC/CoxF family maturation factor
VDRRARRSNSRRTTLPAHIRKVCVEPVQAEVADLAPPGAFYLVLTHSHDLDLAITQAVLQRGDFAYLGLIGSQPPGDKSMSTRDVVVLGASAPLAGRWPTWSRPNWPAR